VKGTEARYGALYWDEVEGDLLSYSPDELHLARGRAPPRANLRRSWNFPSSVLDKLEFFLPDTSE